MLGDCKDFISKDDELRDPSADWRIRTWRDRISFTNCWWVKLLSRQRKKKKDNKQELTEDFILFFSHGLPRKFSFDPSFLECCCRASGKTVCFVYVFTYTRVSPLLNICNLGRWTGYNVNSEPLLLLLLLVKVAAAVDEIFQVLQKNPEPDWRQDNINNKAWAHYLPTEHSIFSFRSSSSYSLSNSFRRDIPKGAVFSGKLTERRRRK